MKTQNPRIHISSRNGAISAKSGEPSLPANWVLKAVMALVDPAFIDQAIRLSQKTEVIELATNIAFQNAFIENLAFPDC